MHLRHNLGIQDDLCECSLKAPADEACHLVDPHNLSEIMSALEIRLFFGGGTFNPIVPFYKRFPSNRRDLSQKTSTYSGRALVKVDNLGSKS